MTDKEFEQAFEAAEKRWNEVNSMIDRRMARYFFFAGGEFGVAALNQMTSERTRNFRQAVSENVATLTKS